ncbi:MAG: SDR family oxidoreductase [Clostridiales bacterium]|nr:SDR family oxidoreductase [Clostridiales bacterium]
MLTLEGRIAIITGGTGFQGEGIVEALAKSGMTVVMITHNMERATKMIEALGEYGKYCLALSNEKGDDAVVEDVYERFGSVDVIITNHGMPEIKKPIAETTPEELTHKFEHQIIGSYKIIKRALPYLEKSKAGRIILVTNGGARSAVPGEGLGGNIVEGGIIYMAGSMARELAPKGITVNCIVKSGLLNDQPVKNPDGFDVNKYVDRIPMGRTGTAGEFGAAAAWLASEESGFVTGQVVRLDGGQLY